MFNLVKSSKLNKSSKRLININYSGMAVYSRKLNLNRHYVWGSRKRPEKMHVQNDLTVEVVKNELWILSVQENASTQLDF